MTVYFIGAGPGAPDLITLRAINIIKQCPTIIYAGSLIPQEILTHATQNAEIHDSAPLHLQQIMDLILTAHQENKDIARLHSGDPSLYGAISEQMDILRDHDIPFEIVPGVTAYSAAAAKFQQELTLPNISQSVILTRTAIRASAMPENETLENFAKTGATLAIHLSINNLAKIVKTLTPYYGEDCPVYIAYRASWADEQYITGTLRDIRDKVKKSGITRTALIFVGHVLGARNATPSHLYDASHHHVLREKTDK